MVTGLKKEIPAWGVRAVDSFSCESRSVPGQLEASHEWIYQGRRTQLYRCGVCHSFITKADLKEGTDA